MFSGVSAPRPRQGLPLPLQRAKPGLAGLTAMGALLAAHLLASPSFTRRLQMVIIFMFSQLGLELNQCQHPLAAPSPPGRRTVQGQLRRLLLRFSGALTWVCKHLGHL